MVVECERVVLDITGVAYNIILAGNSHSQLFPCEWMRCARCPEDGPEGEASPFPTLTRDECLLEGHLGNLKGLQTKAL